MDPSLSKTIKLLLEGDGKKMIGLPGKSDIGLAGLGIQDPHVRQATLNLKLFFDVFFIFNFKKGSITVQGDKFIIEATNSKTYSKFLYCISVSKLE